MRVPFAITIIVFMLGLCVYMARNPEPLAAAAPTVTNGERWTRMCQVEAPRAVKDCVDRYALGAAFENFQTDYKRRLRDAAR